MPNEPHNKAESSAAQPDDTVDTDTTKVSETSRDEASEPAPPERPAERFDPENRPKEYGGRKGPDPVRYGDWEKNGRCIDF